jgi:AcrR family transcriptional regulator
MFSLSSDSGEIGRPSGEAPDGGGIGRSLRHGAIDRAMEPRRGEAHLVVEAIMGAGRTLIERDAVLDFNMRELLAMAGVSNRAFYRFFGTKEALVAALAGEAYDNLVRAAGEALAGSDTFRERLGRWVDAVLSFACDPAVAARGRVFVAYEARLREQYPELFRATGRALVGQLLSAWKESRQSGVADVDAGVQEAKLAVRLVVATLEHHTFERSIPTVEERDAIVALLCRAWM